MGADGKWADQGAASAKCLGLSGIWRSIATALVVIYSQAVLTLWHVNKSSGGSFMVFAETELGNGLWADTWHVVTSGMMYPSAISSDAWCFLGYFFTCSIVLMNHVPGPTVDGPVTPTGHVPRYIENGVTAFVLHLAAFYLGSAAGLYSLGVVYDELGGILNALNYLALAAVVLLYIKGALAPCTKDVGSYGNVMMDLFWGTELYPRVLGIDVKQLTNCRFGMTYWAVATLSCLAKATELNGGVVPLSNLVGAALQVVYLFKFFWWEAGYFRSIDIMQDHAGYYLCWGCLVYVPTLYTSMSVFMVEHRHGLEGQPWLAAAVLALGLTSIWLNYDMDEQRAEFRRSGGAAPIWGKKPKFIEAKYVTADGKTRTSLLLLSGWWGMARHFHYVPEVLAAFLWSCTAGFSHFMPFFYTCFLIVLLLNRSFRDDDRCQAKYGRYWNRYKEAVPSRIVPFIF